MICPQQIWVLENFVGQLRGGGESVVTVLKQLYPF
jgi:hypothetical protein